jgi:hypothetical protein
VDAMEVVVDGRKFMPRNLIIVVDEVFISKYVEFVLIKE